MPNSSKKRPYLKLAGLNSALRLVYCLLLLVFVVSAFGKVNIRQALAEVHLSPSWLALAFISLGGYYLAYAEVWRRVTAIWGIPLTIRASYLAWLQSQIGKYFPARLGLVVQRITIYKKAFPAKTKEFLVCLLIEFMAAVTAGLIWAALTKPAVFPIRLSPIFWAGLVSGLSLLLLWAGSTRSPKAKLRPFKIGLTLLIFSMGGWLFSGAALFFVAAAAGAEAGFVECLAMYVTAGVAGNLALFAPAGLGVRDGLIYVGFRPLVGENLALAVICLSRLTSLFSDLMVSAGAYLYGKNAGDWLKAAAPPRPRRRLLHPAEKVVQAGLCLGCGFCEATSSIAAVTMKFDAQAGGYRPALKEAAAAGPDRLVCPGRGFDLPKLTLRVNPETASDPMVGPCRRIFIGYAGDESLRLNGASGGLAGAVLNELFQKKMIDCAYVSRTGQTPGDVQGCVIRSPDEIPGIQGSLYQPVRHGRELRSLLNGRDRFAFVGLPCQLAALELAKTVNPGLSARHFFSVGLFCGGLNSARAFSWYLKQTGFNFQTAARLRRHGPWPSGFRFSDEQGNALGFPVLKHASGWSKLKYLAAFQGPWRLPRCLMCPDMLADLADLSLGDPHHKALKAASAGFSLVVVRTERAFDLISAMEKSGASVLEEECGPEAVAASQQFSLDNRRRVSAWIRMAGVFGFKAPALGAGQGGRNVPARYYIWAFCDFAYLRIPRRFRVNPLLPGLKLCEYLFFTYLPLWKMRKVWDCLRRWPGSGNAV
jgi:coenzyme F420 hydrogenase subunit beta